MNFACRRCGEIHTTNPTECRSCGHSVFSRITDRKLSELSTGIDKPDSIDPAKIGTVGSAPELEYDSSPDVAVDGSIKQEESDDEQSDGGFLSRMLSLFR